MRAILSIASTSFRESIRNRTVLGIFFLAIGFIASALLLAELALDQRVRVIKDWGLFCVSAFGVVLAIIMGVNQVQKEIRRKTLYVVLTRPIARWQYVVGKYLGLALTLLCEVGTLSLALLVLLLCEPTGSGAIDWTMVQVLLVSLVEILLVAAIAVFFGSFSSPYLSGFFTLGLFAVGRSLPELILLSKKIDVPALKAILKGLFFILPDLAEFNLDTRAIAGLEIGWPQVGWLCAYGFGYLALMLLLSSWIFSRRNLI
jgi:ABC-type transport system involved in multi-copper enzyme maturation permease subunit